MGRKGRKGRKAKAQAGNPAIPYWEPLARVRLSRGQQASIVLRHLVPLALLALFGGSVLQFLLLSVFNIAFTIAAIGTVGVAVSTRQEVVSTGWADQLGALFALAAVCIGASLMLSFLFGWVIALVVADEAKGLWDPSLWLGVLGIVASAVPGMVMQYRDDLRAGLSEEARKRRDQPVVGVHLFSAGFIFLLSGFTLGWEGVGAVLLALLVTALFIFRDLRPDLARALAR
jgi:ABC-type antimicrobial peptide transport system permease subunit